MVTVIVQILIMNVVLKTYSEVEALGRTGIFQFVVGLAVVLLQTRQIIDAFLENITYMIIQVVLQIFISAFQIIVMKHLTALEMFVNLATAALWVPFVIDSASSIAAKDFLVDDKEIIIISLFDGLGLLLIFVGIVVFYCYSNLFFEKFNKRLEVPREEITEDSITSTHSARVPTLPQLGTI